MNLCKCINLFSICLLFKLYIYFNKMLFYVLCLI